MEKKIFLIGAARTAKTRSDSATTATGRRITNRAVCAQRPSDLGVIPDLRTTNLSTRSLSLDLCEIGICGFI